MSKEKEYNYFYKVTNLINEKYYYGIHSTNNFEDGYMGSGHAIKKAIKKYGRKNFTKEIIADYPTRKEAIEHEKLVVTIELIKLEECYNLVTGGENENVYSKESKERHRLACTGEKNGFYGKKHTKEVREINSKKHIGVKRSIESIEKQSNALKGRICTDEHRKKISKSNKGKVLSIETKEKIRLVNIGKKHSEEHKQKIRDSLLLKKPGSKKCMINGNLFLTLRSAGEYYNINHQVVKYRINSTKNEWINWNFYLEKV